MYKWHLSLSEPVPFSGDRREIAFWWWNRIFQFFSQDCSFYSHTAQIKSHLTISPGPFCYSSVPFYTNNCYNMLPCNCFSLCELKCLSCDLIFYHQLAIWDWDYHCVCSSIYSPSEWGRNKWKPNLFSSPLGFHYVSTINLHNTGKLFKTCVTLVRKVDTEGKATSKRFHKVPNYTEKTARNWWYSM